MFNSKNAKRSLLMSALALVLCVSMLVGSTFAWFTDTATTGVNKIQSGTLDIELLMYDGANWVNAEDKTLNFIAKDGNQNILWEPGCTYELPQLKVVNKGNLELKYQIHITGIEGDAKLLEVIDFTIEGEDSLTGTLAPNAESGAITLIGHMDEDAGNDYQTLTMEAISITVVATQMTAENDTYGPDYDEDAWHPAMKVYNANDLQAALNNGETNIVVMDDIDLTESIVIPAAAATYSLRAAANAVTINLNGKTISAAIPKSGGHVIYNAGNLILRNGTVKSVADNGGSDIYNAVGSAMIAENLTVQGAPIAGDSWPSYAINNYGTATINNCVVTSMHGVICSYGEAAMTTLNNVTATISPDGAATGKTSRVLYTYANGKMIVNSGTYTNNAGDAASTGGTVVCNYNSSADATIQINGGAFKGGCGLAEYDKGNILVTGGTFQANPKNYLSEGYAAENENGVYTVLFPQESFDELLDGAVAGDTVEIPAGNFTFPTGLEAGVTLNCAPGTVFEGTSKLDDGVTVIGATFSNPTGTAADQTINGTFKNCTFTGKNGLRWCYAGDTVVFENCVFDGSTYGVHFDGGANDVKFINCTFSGFNALGGEIDLVTMEGCTFIANGRSNYNGINLWGSTTMTDCTFVFDGTAGYEWVDACGDNKTYSFEGCVVTDGKTEKGIETVAGNYGKGNTVIINGEQLCVASNDDVLADAINRGESKIILGTGEYTADLYVVSANRNLTIIGQGADTKLNFKKGQVRLALFDSLTIENCTLGRMVDKSWGQLVFGSSEQAGGVYTISNCILSGEATQGIYINQTVAATFNINNCTFNGDFGSEGAITIQNNDGVNITVNVNDCEFNNIPATSHEIYVKYAYNGWTLNAEGVNAYWNANS